jgi:hypothetical protein
MDQGYGTRKAVDRDAPDRRAGRGRRCGEASDYRSLRSVHFMQRYRSGWEHNRGEEFDAPFARIDRMGPDRFDIYWMRHAGKWWRLHAGVTLADALRILETDGVLHPV